MEITRHFVDVGPRRVHYRRCGHGPVLLMVHQSPRSSKEYEALMHVCGVHFTCIAPDSPGFGQSDALPDPVATIDDFADAVVDLPSAYGEHLVWLWHRVLEQSWFFPWFAAEPRFALSVAHDDPARVDAVVRELLDSGNAYRTGYGAVLRAPRDIPPADAVTPPALITAYDGDPLQPHLDRLGAMPSGWRAHRVATPAEHQAASLAFLLEHPATPVEKLVESAREGFLRITTDDYDGLIHWRGSNSDTVMTIHAPDRSAELVEGFAIDLPGHGQSNPWPGDAPVDWTPWHAVIVAAGQHFGMTGIVHEPLPQGDPDRLLPDLAPDRFGAYLTIAWQIVRTAHCFAPWYEANAAHARDFDPAALDPARLAIEHRALLQANAARASMKARQSATGDDHGNP